MERRGFLLGLAAGAIALLLGPTARANPRDEEWVIVDGWIARRSQVAARKTRPLR